MLKKCTKSKVLKMTRIGQNSTIKFNKGYSISPDGVKRSLRHLKKPHLETPNIKGFQKKAIFPFKRGLKGVLRGRKGGLKKIMNFSHFTGFSQTPFFTSEVIR